MGNKKIYNFAIKWINKFREKNWNFHDIFESDKFPNECRELKFEMDCGNKFVEAYGNEMMKGNILESEIEKINDIMLLGSGIFSNWRYFNHWAYAGPSEEDVKWFVVALTRLAELTKE